ncbi:MAG: DNA methyltransferase [Dehalococcoidia bacterium]
MTKTTSNTPTVVATPLTALHPAPWNPRTIADERFQNLCGSVRSDPEFLWRRPVLAQADGTIYAGNMRYLAAQYLGFETIPAVIEQVSDQLARERALRDNQQWGEWEHDDLAALLTRLREDGSDVELLGFDERELQQLLDRLSPTGSLSDPDEVPALPDEPITKVGDLWNLGGHRVLCGDASVAEDVARVMDGSLASCVWTDAPYGVNYVGGTREHLTLKNDTPEGLADLLARSFAAIDSAIAPGAALYFAHPAGPGSVVFAEAFIRQGWRLHQQLVWVKSRLVLGHSDYHYRHEPILFGYKSGASGRRGRGGRGWYGDNTADSVFEVPTPTRNDDHPTSKPVALIEPMLRNSSRTGEVVLDPFLGSGSTLIAAEQLGRRCFGIDLDPRYVDVAVRRWESFTGQRAQLSPRTEGR